MNAINLNSTTSFKNSFVSRKTSTFKDQRKSITSFKGQLNLSKLPEIKALPRTSSDFTSKITQKILEFPKRRLEKFKENNFKIILSPTLSEGYSAQKVFDPNVLHAELLNLKGTLGVTYFEEKLGNNFFVFADKPPYSNIYMSGIVNHEFAHGIENIEGLSRNKDILNALKQDIDLIIKQKKLDKLSESERKLVSFYFFNPKARLPVDEIIADSIAWQQKGGGSYGSGLIGDIKNPDLIPSLFTTLSAKLKQRGLT